MNKKIILFIGLMVCFLGILAYVENIEKQKQEESGQAELKQTEIASSSADDVASSSASAEATEDKPRNDEAGEEINWDNVTPEYFLTEDIFNTDAKTGLAKFDRSENEELNNMFVRHWYDENNVPFITIAIMEYKDKIFDSEFDLEYSAEKKSGLINKMSENTIMTYFDGFMFQDEIINRYEIERKQEQDVETAYYLDWFENRFNFSIKVVSLEYQDDMREIAENIINKYSK